MHYSSLAGRTGNLTPTAKLCLNISSWEQQARIFATTAEHEVYVRELYHSRQMHALLLSYCCCYSIVYIEGYRAMMGHAKFFYILHALTRTPICPPSAPRR